MKELSEEQQQLVAEADVLEAKVKAFADKLRDTVGLDNRREVSLGITHSEDAFMRLRRAITAN